MQRDLGFKLVADVSYVGSVGRRMLQTRNINAVPYGANSLPSSIDPTTGGLCNAFNNVQFSTVNTAAIFNAAGQQTNAEFGQYTAARDARRIQLTIRVDF